MPYSSRRVLICCALLFAVAIPLSGCGSDDTKKSNAYVTAVNTIQTDVNAQLSKAVALISPTSAPAVNAKALDSSDAAIAAGVARLKAVKPPSKIAALNTQLIAAVDGLRAPIKKARAALRRKSLPDVAAAQTGLIQGLNGAQVDFKAVIDKINTKLHE